MAFDISTARPEQQQGFDTSTAQPLQQAEEDIGSLEAFGSGFRRGIEQLSGGAAQRMAEFSLNRQEQRLKDFADKINSGEIPPTPENIQQFDDMSSFVDFTRQKLETAGGREEQRREEFGEVTEQRPISGTIGNIAGQVTGTATLSPASLFSLPATLPGRTALSATTGATLGAAQPTIGNESVERNVAVGTAIGAVAPAALEKVVAPIARTVKDKFLAPAAQRVVNAFSGKQSPFKEEIKNLIEAGVADNKTAKFVLDGSGKVTKDPLAAETLNQGFNEGVVAAIKGSTPKDRSQMAKILGTLKKGRTNARFAAENRPSDVVGNSVVDRFKVVREANKAAGKQLDGVANSLKGRKVNVDDAVNSFISDLDSMGVSVVNGRPNFSGSVIEGLDGPEKAIKRLVSRMSTGGVDAFDAHRLKKFIDESVTFGKTGEGLGGKTESIMKGLRRNIDQSLDNTFPRYKDVNDRFAETIGALDGFQDAIGSKINLSSPNADKAVGTVSRRLLGNAQSRANLIDSLNGLQNIANKHGGKFDDDIITQAMFVDELESMFGATAKTSLQGDVQKAALQAAKGGGIIDRGAQAAELAVKAARGVSEDNAIKSMEKLLGAK